MSDTIGPQIPHKPTNSYEDDDTDVIGPALPPGFSAKPPAARAVLTTPKEDQHNVPLSSQAIVGPCLPPTSGSRPGDVQTALDSESDDDFVGPSVDLAVSSDAAFDPVAEFIARNESLQADKKRLEEENLSRQGCREEWMLSLPEVGMPKDIGLTARSFRNKSAPEQDTSWTQTPQQRAAAQKEAGPKPASKREYVKRETAGRDDELSKKLRKYNDAHRPESLVELHQKQLKKDKKKESGEKAERVPFSRETDLQVNRFDEAQRKSVLKKAAQLDSRFGHGSQKYE